MANITLTTGITTSGQIPVDGKNYFLTQADAADLGTDDINAYTYYERMIITIADDGTQWIWREEISTGETGGLVTTSYQYIDGVVSNGIDYSLRTFNFFTINSNLARGSINDATNSTNECCFTCTIRP